jgi:hypothetical protein
LKKKMDLLAELKKKEEEHGTLTLLFGARDSEHNQAVSRASAKDGINDQLRWLAGALQTIQREIPVQIGCFFRRKQRLGSLAE